MEEENRTEHGLSEWYWWSISQSDGRTGGHTEATQFPILEVLENQGNQGHQKRTSLVITEGGEGEFHHFLWDTLRGRVLNLL